MGYYMRVLSTSAEVVPMTDFIEHIKAAGQSASLECTSEDQQNWTQIIAYNAGGLEITNLEREVVAQEGLAKEELDEFAEEIADCRPASAIPWLLEKFKSVKTIYSFQVLSGAYVDDGWDVIHSMMDSIFDKADCISQIDNEGFSNFERSHVLWQFEDDVKDLCTMAVLKDKQWHHFNMDLGNLEHRATYLAGEVPAGVEVEVTDDI